MLHSTVQVELKAPGGSLPPGCAYFLRHSDFLGALGSLQGALRAAGGAEIGVGDVLSARSKTRNHREHVAHNGERGPLLIQSLLHRTN